MDRDTAIAQIQFDLGNRSDLFDAIALKLQQAQRLLEMGKSLPYFLKRSNATFTLEPGEAFQDAPDDFIREFPQDTFHYDGENDKIVFLEKTDRRNALLTFGTSTGRPKAYRLSVDAFEFFPTPDLAYVYRWSYYATATSLTSNVADNAWLMFAPDILIGTAGSMMAEVLQHAAAKARFDNLALGAWKGAFAEGILRDEENDPLEMGSMV